MKIEDNGRTFIIPDRDPRTKRIRKVIEEQVSAMERVKALWQKLNTTERSFLLVLARARTPVFRAVVRTCLDLDGTPFNRLDAVVDSIRWHCNDLGFRSFVRIHREDKQTRYSVREGTASQLLIVGATPSARTGNRSRRTEPVENGSGS